MDLADPKRSCALLSPAGAAGAFPDVLETCNTFSPRGKLLFQPLGVQCSETRHA